MDCATGVLACSTASLIGDFVCKPTRSTIRSVAEPVSPAGCQATWVPCMVYSQNRQRLRHLQYRGIPLRGGDDDFNDDCCFFCCISIPHFCWVLQVCWDWDDDRLQIYHSHLEPSWAVAPTSADVITFVAALVMTASPSYVVAHVRLHRNNAKFSWRRGVFLEGFFSYF